MKEILAILFVSSFLYAQSNLFEPGYSGIGARFSRTLDDISLNSISITRHTSSNYFIEATLNYVDNKYRTSNLNSVNLGFSKILFREENQVLLSGYTHLGIGFIKIRDINYVLDLGFGLFHSFTFTKFSFVPEFIVNYAFMLNTNSEYSLLNPRQYTNRQNRFILAFFLNNVIQLSDRSSFIISPGIETVERDHYYRIKAGFNFSI